MRLTMKVSKNAADDAWAYTAQCVEIPGAVSEGATQKEAVENVLSAVHDILELRRSEARKAVKRTAAGSRPSLRTVVLDA